MKAVTVSLLDAALLDLEAGRQFYDGQDPGVGQYFLDSVFEDIQSLRDTAGIHPVHFGYPRMLAKRFPFAIYYELDENSARVVAVLDMRQNHDGIRSTLGWRSIQSDS